MMRERSDLSMQVVAIVVVMVVVAVHEITAKPTLDATHQPNEANHVEDQYLDDALGDWLDNFGTYTFMVKQDLDAHSGDADEGDEEGGQGQEVDVGAAIDEAEGEVEEEEEEVEEGWSAPIAVSTGSKSLLDPRHDFLVTVESLVAEEGSIFLTLSKYENQTRCGVGGLTLEQDVGEAPRRDSSGDHDVGQGSTTSNSDNNHLTTFISFRTQQEGNATSPDTSKWIAVSEQYWWARGQLGGGNMLSITFTPPECGCLFLSTYFALPVGNLTLVVGPQAYPDELQTLLCVDPLPSVQDHTYDEEEKEEEEEEEEEVVPFLQQPSALVSSRSHGEDETETEVEENTEQVAVTSRKRKMSREEKKMAKKTRRQMKRQRIRQAGRRQAIQEGEAGGGRRAGRRWNRKKNQRKKVKAWKKIHKRGRKGRRRNQGGNHHHHHHDGMNGTAPENMTQHHHHHHHSAHGLNASITNHHEERLVDILLRDQEVDNSTLEEENAQEEEGDEVVMANEEVEGEEEYQTPRERRKNRRQRKKMMRKQRRKVYPSGIKFCCKQGVKHKKNILEVDSTTSGATPSSCNMSINVVSTFANHQFGIEEDTCTTTFTTCCQKFTQEMWEDIKVKKEARKTERKQRRKSKRQDRKQQRKQKRRLRKEMKRQSHNHHHDDPV